MNKIGLPLIVVGVLIVAGIYNIKHPIGNTGTSSPKTDILYQELPFKIDGRTIQLKDGVSQIEPTPSSALFITTKYFGNEAHGDINNDAIPDHVFLVTQNPGGSGTFYYVIAAVSTQGTYKMSEAYLLGDRIAPQSTNISVTNNVATIVVNFADRASSEPFTTQPHIGKTVRLILDKSTLRFGIVATNFEGEADTSRMTLTGHEWHWTKTIMNNGTVTTPQRDAFVLTFKDDKSFSSRTDCNGVGGVYKTNNTALSFDRMMSTLMYCDGSQESIYSTSLSKVVGYHFTSKGDLILELGYDSGTMIFK